MKCNISIEITGLINYKGYKTTKRVSISNLIWWEHYSDFFKYTILDHIYKQLFVL